MLLILPCWTPWQADSPIIEKEAHAGHDYHEPAQLYYTCIAKCVLSLQM